ncbi:hypothetical protein WJX81_003804 [Elliptochloris bilobata]|uniref:Uncharacterized protein n=1 Tax=Elliptochloris bilobata TaxID=381761 RepID=A0AAW1QKU8_9CHLO
MSFLSSKRSAVATEEVKGSAVEPLRKLAASWLLDGGLLWRRSGGPQAAAEAPDAALEPDARSHSAPDAAERLPPLPASGAAAHESRAALKREHAVRNGRARGFAMPPAPQVAA